MMYTAAVAEQLDLLSQTTKTRQTVKLRPTIRASPSSAIINTLIECETPRTA